MNVIRGVVLGTAALVCAGAVLSSAASPASAAVVTVLNPSFESPTTGTYTTLPTPVTDWGNSTNAEGGVFNALFVGYTFGTSGFSFGAPDGTQGLYAQSDTFGPNVWFQDVGVVVPGATYDLSLYVGQNPGGSGLSPADIALVTGFSNGIGPSYSAFASSHGAVTPSSGQWLLTTLTGIAPKTATGDLWILLGTDFAGAGNGVGQADFDNVSLRETPASAVPEPATWGMMLIGFGLVGLQLRRRTVKEVTC